MDAEVGACRALWQIDLDVSDLGFNIQSVRKLVQRASLGLPDQGG